jgi:RHS repeat-associated protein
MGTGFYWYRTRYYNPRAGRFTSRDTIGIWGDPLNLGNGYTFVGNNPWTMMDSYGQGFFTSEYCPAWHSRAWSYTNELGLTIRCLPENYWKTLKNGEQASSSAGYIDALTDTLNPFGGAACAGLAGSQAGDEAAGS